MDLSSGNLIIVGLVVVTFAIVVGALLTSKGSEATADAALPYDKEDALLSRAESQFYLVLCKVVGYKYHIFPKVRMIDLVRVRVDSPNARSHKNRILSKHVDFVLCTRDTFKPVMVIELDDSSHRSSSRQARDAIKDRALEAAGLPLLRVTVTNWYDEQEVAGSIWSKLGQEAGVAGERSKR